MDFSPTAATDPSATLVRLSGDFAQDVLPFRTQLYRYALSRTKNAADAEDLLQETMLSAFKAYGGLRPDSHLKSWLMTIMRNTWIDGHRVASRRPVETTLDDAIDAKAIASSAVTRDQRSAESRLLDADFDPDVVDAMGCLSESMRRTVFLVAVMGLDSREAARVLGVSPGTVLTRMHRSRDTLRKKLSGRHPEATRRDAA
ncbi:sigma-70 family RNA polymerase sigma factor [Mycolicibacterium hodleri]